MQGSDWQLPGLDLPATGEKTLLRRKLSDRAYRIVRRVVGHEPFPKQVVQDLPQSDALLIAIYYELASMGHALDEMNEKLDALVTEEDLRREIDSVINEIPKYGKLQALFENAILRRFNSYYLKR